MSIVAASGALVFTSTADGRLRASTAGGHAVLRAEDAERIGRELLAWARGQGSGVHLVEIDEAHRLPTTEGSR